MSKIVFPHPWPDRYSPDYHHKPTDEWFIFDISNLIRSKQNWKTKYKNQEIVAKWKEELKPQFSERTKNFHEIFEYTLRELEWYEYFEKTFPKILDNGFTTVIGDKIVISDSAVKEELNSLLKNQVDEFTKTEFANGEYDFHPNSHQTVVDIVHPSLYPLQYGITPIFANPNPEDKALYSRYRYRKWPCDFQGPLFEKVHEERGIEICKFDKAKISDVSCSKGTKIPEYAISRKFQWLPALMTQETWNGEYNFRSYINNLHPQKYKDLYKTIAGVFNALIPGLNLVLSRLSTTPYKRIDLPNDNKLFFSDEWAKEDDELKWGDENYTERRKKLDDTKQENLKNIPPVYGTDPIVNYDFDIVRDFPRLKVIVKLANIELSPKNSKYKGGSWHVEGTINENIVATILYYYDSENISELNLSFREEIPEVPYGDEIVFDHFYGYSDQHRRNRNLGSVETKQDRLLIFPNVYQHHVDDFELKDKSKPGHRKILCMFLVDPTNEVVLTTDDVPPQQQLWWEDDTDLSVAGLSEFAKMKITDLKRHPIPLDVTKIVRADLMSERSVPELGEGEYSEEAFERTFSLCEH